MKFKTYEEFCAARKKAEDIKQSVLSVCDKENGEFRLHINVKSPKTGKDTLKLDIGAMSRKSGKSEFEIARIITRLSTTEQPQKET